MMTVSALLSPAAMKELVTHDVLIPHRVLSLEFKTQKINIVYAPAVSSAKKNLPRPHWSNFIMSITWL